MKILRCHHEKRSLLAFPSSSTTIEYVSCGFPVWKQGIWLGGMQCTAVMQVPMGARSLLWGMGGPICPLRLGRLRPSRRIGVFLTGLFLAYRFWR